MSIRGFAAIKAVPEVGLGKEIALEGRVARRLRLPWVPIIVIAVLAVLAVFAPWVSPYSPLAQKLTDRLIPPLGFGGSLTHILGTDQLGRDILSRIIFGARVSFSVALATLVLGGGVGGILGLLAGYYGGKAEAIVMRAADSSFAFPSILLAMLLTVTLGASLWTVILAIAVVIWAHFARLVRGEVLSIKERDWVTQARINGCSDFRIMALHIAPHVINTWVVLATLQMGMVILMEATLSFLGAGIPPPTPAWGQMVSQGRDIVTTSWWVPIMPGLAIMILVLSFNMLGDWLREVLDPKLRQV